MDKKMLEPIVENIAIKASSVLINTAKKVITGVLQKTVGRTQAADEAIDKLMDGISGRVYEMVADKIRKAVDFGHDEIVKPIIDKQPDSRPESQPEKPNFRELLGKTDGETKASASMDDAKTALDRIEEKLRERIKSGN
jgi:uncharacterized protein YoaH (UPF0181 family)